MAKNEIAKIMSDTLGRTILPDNLRIISHSEGIKVFVVQPGFTASIVIVSIEPFHLD